MGLNCAKLLPPNKRFIEPTPYADYPTRNSLAIRPRSLTRAFPRSDGVGRRAQFAPPVIGRGGCLGTARSSVIGVPLRHRAASERSGCPLHCVHGQRRLESADHPRPDRPPVRRRGARYVLWLAERSLPHESKFSRAFAEFAATHLPQQLHEAVIAATQSERLIEHIARDSTAIPARGH